MPTPFLPFVVSLYWCHTPVFSLFLDSPLLPIFTRKETFYSDVSAEPKKLDTALCVCENETKTSHSLVLLSLSVWDGIQILVLAFNIICTDSCEFWTLLLCVGWILFYSCLQVSRCLSFCISPTLFLWLDKRLFTLKLPKIA